MLRERRVEDVTEAENKIRAVMEGPRESAHESQGRVQVRVL
jgi:hypothetical protein